LNFAAKDILFPAFFYFFGCQLEIVGRMPLARLSKQAGKDLIASVTAVLFDCDGVIWHPQGPIDGAAQLLESLRNMGKKVIFVTNNNTKSITQLGEKFKKFGIKAEEDEIFGTARVAAVYLKHVLKCDKKTYLIGSQGIAEELHNVGIESTPVGPCLLPGENSEEIAKRVDLRIDKDIGAVLVGFDEHISFQKIAFAMTHLKNPKTHFIATNTDGQFPMGDGTYIPGTGVMVKAVMTASERDPIIMGKPEQPMLDAIRAIHDIEPSRTLMVGDRLDTDIAFGRRWGMKTLAVLSGVASLEQLEKVQSEDKDSELLPDYFAGSVKDILDCLIAN